MKTKTRSRKEQVRDRLKDVFDELHALGAWQVHLVIGEQNGTRFRYLTLEGTQDAAFMSKIDNIMITLKRQPEEMVEIETTAVKYVEEE